MSAETSLQEYSDATLRKIAKFFEHYRPTYQDAEWAKARQKAVKAEIALREREEEQAHQ